MLDHIYEKEVTILVPVKAPAAAQPGSVARFGVRSTWTACSEHCVIESGSAAADVRLGQSAGKRKATTRRAFDEADKRIPRPIAETRAATVRTDGGMYVIEAPGARRLAFFPATGCVELEDLVRNGERAGPTLRLRPVEGSAGPLKGIIEVTRGSPETREWYSLDHSLMPEKE